MSLENFIADVPLFDHHCHFLIQASVQNRAERLARVSSEADSQYPLNDTKNRLAWFAFQAEAQEFALNPNEPLAPMNATEYATYNQRIFSHYHFEKMLIDTGFIPDNPVLDLAETAKITGVAIKPIFRLETHAEEWLVKTDNFDDWWSGLRDQVAHARASGYVGFKSIAAYRFGLRLTNVSLTDAKAAYQGWRDSGITRLSSPVLISYLLWQLAPVIIEQNMPLQFHVGYGDADTDLYEGNPLLMRPFLQSFCQAGLKVVLLHCYPYHREAGYLASVFPNLYFDTSLIDPLGPSSVTRVLNESLELAPYNRYLFASDASTYPEMYGVAAKLFKQSLTAHFKDLTMVPTQQKERWIQQICHETSEQIYLEEN